MSRGEADALVHAVRLAALQLDRVLVGSDVQAWRPGGDRGSPSIAHHVAYLRHRWRNLRIQLQRSGGGATAEHQWAAARHVPSWPPVGPPPAERPARLIRTWRTEHSQVLRHCATTLATTGSPVLCEAVTAMLLSELHALHEHRLAIETILRPGRSAPDLASASSIDTLSSRLTTSQV